MKSNQNATVRNVKPVAAPRFVAMMTEPELDAKFAKFTEEIAEIVAAKPVQKLKDTNEVAQWMAVSDATIRKLRDEGMPFLRIGETYRYDIDAIRAWLANRDTSKAGAR